MKLWIIITLFIIGIIAFLFGSLFRLMHWPLGPELITTSIILLLAAGLLTLTKAVKQQK